MASAGRTEADTCALRLYGRVTLALRVDSGALLPFLRLCGDRNGGSRSIKEQLLAGLVFLAQHNILLPTPALVQVQFAETGVAIAIRVGLPILLPEQLLSQV